MVTKKKITKTKIPPVTVPAQGYPGPQSAPSLDAHVFSIQEQAFRLQCLQVAERLITNPVFGLQMTLPNVEGLAALIRYWASTGIGVVEQIQRQAKSALPLTQEIPAGEQKYA